MNTKVWSIILVVMNIVLISAWKSSMEDTNQREPRRGIHYHSKRHMLPNQIERKKRGTTTKPGRELRKKPTGHLKPLEDDEMENDEVVSVAIGPPPMRPKFEKPRRPTPKPTTNVPANTTINFAKDILYQLGTEFIFHQVSEDFVFGQYVGNAMKNLTSELKVKMQHEILELVVKYQKLNRGDPPPKPDEKNAIQALKDIKVEKKGNETEEPWADFSNLAKIVG